MKPVIRAVLIVLAATMAGVAGSLLASVWLPAPPVLHDHDFRMERGETDAYEVRPGHPLIVPFPFADFDLYAEVELASDTDLDLVVRHVEPVQREAGMPLFHARYAAVRSSSRASGPAVRSRESALFDHRDEGGVMLAPGRVATIQLEGRGRVIRGNIAGIALPAFATADRHGGFAMVAPRGLGLVRTFVVQRMPRPLALLPIGWAAIGAGLLGLCLVALRCRARRVLGALLLVPALAWVGGALVLHWVVPESEPDTASVVLVALAGAPAALLSARLRNPVIALVLGALVAMVAFELVARIERARLAPFEDPRLTACFGWGSGSTPFDVLVPRLRARAAVHIPEAVAHRAFFLGGGMLYEGGVDREDWIGPLAASTAFRALEEPVEGVVVPTLYSSAYQQLALFERFCAESFPAHAVVFAVPPWEGERTEPYPTRQALAGEFTPWDGTGSALWSLWSASRRDEVATTDADGLGRTLREFDELARDHGMRVSYVAAQGLREDLRAVVEATATELGRDYRLIDFDSDPQRAIESLGAWLTEVFTD